MATAEKACEKEDVERVQEAGLTALRAGDLEKAVDFLGNVLEKKVKLYGELAPECAFTYFKYGSALFYKSQEETDVLGNTAAKKAEKLSASEGKEVTEQEELTKLTAGSSEAKAPESANKDTKGKGPAKEEEEEEEEGDTKEVEDLEEGEGEGEEDESDLALAWRILEVARCIYERMPERSLDEADVIMMLADISLEKEDFASCVADYNRAIALLESIVAPHSRRLAEGYFRLCLAHQTAQQPSQALASCQKAIETCQLSTEHLKSELLKAQQGKEASRDDQAEPTKKEEGPAAGSSSGTSPHELSLEEMENELKEVADVIADLKEKESELKEVMEHPSLKHLFAASTQGQHASKQDATSGARPSGEGESESAGGAEEKSLPTSKQQVLSVASGADIPVAVAGRGKKRIAPTPVDPASQSHVKKLST